MPATPDIPDLADRASFTTWSADFARFGDTDRIGHINNAAYATYLETARTALFVGPPNSPVPPGCLLVIVSLSLHFRAEMQWNGPVEIGTRLLRPGRTSFTLGHGIFKDGACCATAESVLVLIDEATRRPTPLTEAFRARLGALGPPDAPA